MSLIMKKIAISKSFVQVGRTVLPYPLCQKGLTAFQHEFLKYMKGILLTCY